jgi:hypothetical protein
VGKWIDLRSPNRGRIRLQKPARLRHLEIETRPVCGEARLGRFN